MGSDLKLALSHIDKRHGTGDIDPQEFLVLMAAPADEGFVPALIAEIAGYYPPAHIVCFTVPANEGGQSARAREKHWRVILATLAEVLGLPPLRPGQETFRAQAHLERELWDRADFLVVDHAEQLGPALGFFRRDLRGRPPVLLVTRDYAALQAAFATDFSLARRALHVSWNPPGR